MSDTASVAMSGIGTILVKYLSSSDISITLRIFWLHLGQLSFERHRLENFLSLVRVENIPLEIVRVTTGTWVIWVAARVFVVTAGFTELLDGPVGTWFVSGGVA